MLLRTGFQRLQRTAHQLLLASAVRTSSVAADRRPVAPTSSADAPDGDLQQPISGRLRKPARPPLLRNFFAGQVDAELLAYPEPIPRDEMTALDAHVSRSAELLAGSEALAAFRTGQSDVASAELLDELRTLGAFGLNAPASAGGQERTASQLIRLAEPESAADVDLAQLLNAHRLAVRCVAEFGSAAQRQRWLSALSAGQRLGAVALHEADAGPAIFRTLAVQTDAGWQLSGEKHAVPNGRQADVLVVFAQTRVLDHVGDPTDAVGAFLVERGAAGVQALPAGRRLANVRLDRAVGEPLGAPSDGTRIAQRMLLDDRLQAAGLALGVQKRLLAHWSEFARASSGTATQHEQLGARLSRAHCDAYALDSMLYLTAGLLDEYTDADVDVETAALRVFAGQALRRTATMALEFAGTRLGSDAGDAADLRAALQLIGQGECNDTLRTFIGLSGVKHAGETLHDIVRKVRNPLYNPAFMFRRLFETPNIEQPKPTLQLNHNVHPSLDPASQWLEQSVLRLQAATETTLTRHGQQIVERQCELRRLALMATHSYAAFAAVARASRAYCIGLQHSDLDVLTASAFAFDVDAESRRLALQVRDGPYLNNDVNHQKLAGQLLKSGGYFAAHPLLRNF